MLVTEWRGQGPAGAPRGEPCGQAEGLGSHGGPEGARVEEQCSLAERGGWKCGFLELCLFISQGPNHWAPPHEASTSLKPP